MFGVLNGQFVLYVSQMISSRMLIFRVLKYSSLMLCFHFEQKAGTQMQDRFILFNKVGTVPYFTLYSTDGYRIRYKSSDGGAVLPAPTFSGVSAGAAAI